MTVHLEVFSACPLLEQRPTTVYRQPPNESSGGTSLSEIIRPLIFTTESPKTQVARDDFLKKSIENVSIVQNRRILTPLSPSKPSFYGQ